MTLSFILAAASVWWWGTATMLALLFASSLFSASETALFFLSRADLRKFRTGTLRERRVANLLRNPDQLLTVILFGNLIVNLSYYAISMLFLRQLITAGQPTAAAVVGTGSVAVLILFGDLLPKSLATIHARRVALLVGGPLTICSQFSQPILRPLQALTRALRTTIWGESLKTEPYVSRDDLERAVELAIEEMQKLEPPGGSGGVSSSDAIPRPAVSEAISQLERLVLQNILDLTELRAEEVMRPRGTYRTVTMPIPRSAIQQQVPEFPYLFVEDADGHGVDACVPFSNVIKDHLAGKSFLPASAGQQMPSVPWCSRLAVVLQELRRNYADAAAVVNEHGEVIGVVTEDDIIETIFSEVPSRSWHVVGANPVEEVAPGRFRVHGFTTLRQLVRRLKLTATNEGDEHLTVAGLLHHRLERFPEPGNQCRWNTLEFTVESVSHTRDMRVLVEQRPAEDELQSGKE